ncbi:glycosyltransferase family 25 protein [Pontibaca salina]|uniref:Glycosyltransferase family 25 protein n=1 Tax=Pontibaca salina TaxID=2795731 RepID=A0A934M3Z7_9RHOB|nr:glycosyltransferase family 25 protein [Pontibaca salina]MBI6630374.1 glycosyltransferase family 25 protein [Pontibaca salina]
MSWPILIISLPDAKVRRQAISNALRSLDMPFEIVDAIDGRDGLPSKYETLIDRDKARIVMGRDLTNGEFACALSHQIIYKTIIDRDIPGAIVLEDDAIPLKGFKDFVVASGYQSADLILFDYKRARVWRGAQKLRSGSVILRPVAFNPFLTTGYSVSYRGASYLHESSIPISGQADWPCEIRELKAHITIPRLVGHPQDQSRDSYLEQQRRDMVDSFEKPARYKRFGRGAYWHRWLRKRLSVEIK